MDKTTGIPHRVPSHQAIVTPDQYGNAANNSHLQPLISRTEIGSEGGAEFRVTFEDVTNPGDVSLLVPHPEGLVGVGATVVAREVSPWHGQEKTPPRHGEPQ